MITKNLKNLLAMVLESSATVVGVTPIRDVTGAVAFHPGTFTFPGSRTQAVTTTATAAGISIGTGSTAATENDYQLENTITSGVNLTLTNTVTNVDEFGRPYIIYSITVTNTSDSALTISEVGYKQTLQGTTFPGGSSAGSYVCLLDRTVLANAMTLGAGDAGVVTYTIKTNPYQSKTIGGVKCVSFTWGTDEEVAACIDAARQGTINLQTDCGWGVGDVHIINVGAWTNGAGTTIAAQQVPIAITQFGDYNSSGSLFQFDFVTCCGEARMNSTNTNAGGYGASEMYTTSLPALVTALPSWLQTRLKTFSVLVNSGTPDYALETVSGNKLALRSPMEIFGTASGGIATEGTQIEYYKASSKRVKMLSYPSGTNGDWWERSPFANPSYPTMYNCVTVNGGNVYGATNVYGVAPFGCI